MGAGSRLQIQRDKKTGQLMPGHIVVEEYQSKKFSIQESPAGYRPTYWDERDAEYYEPEPVEKQRFHLFKSKDEKIEEQVEKNMLKMEKLRQEEEKAERKAAEQAELRRRKEAQKAEEERQKALREEENRRQKAIQERETLRKKALRADRNKVHHDKVRHGFYDFIKGFVTFGRLLSGKEQAVRNSTESSFYQKNLLQAHLEMEQKRREYAAEGKGYLFAQQYGAYSMDLIQKLSDASKLLKRQHPHASEEEIEQMLSEVTFSMEFSNRQRANVVGGTKPNAMQFTQDGSAWLVKESRSCIGVEEPNAAIVTEAGYKVQRLVHPDTAIEAFKGKSAGLGTVSYQRMVQNLVKDHVDLFQFSRTPESMTEEELGKVEALAPQILREHTTDWLLYNFDTKGENFILSRNPDGSLKLYGIDKEAGFRAVLDEGAQKMSKDYQRFDQDTVYNQMFRKFAKGEMNFDLQTAEEQIRRVEQMSDADYMGIFAEYIHQQEQDRPQSADEIKRRILQRKQNLRAEYRAFFGELVRERMQAKPEEAEELRRKYFAGVDGGVFLFAGDTPEILQEERERILQQRQANQAELAKRVEAADAADEKSYKRRHAMYDFSKAIVMGLKKLKSTNGIEEQRTTYVPVQTLRREATAEELETGRATLTMGADEKIFLGGTKPMSQYVADDGSLWLAKQAVNCMGYYKIEGALLTEAGANLQKIVHLPTAVDAFVGRTKKHGDVSFQRKVEDIEHGEGALDLFRFSKHPELADLATIQAVQALGPQILREHTTDWLLCNFDTKGENFMITRKPGEERVLHGIDKEAAFNKILDAGAQHMSRTYKPHANNTLYNVVFTMYANAEMDLNLLDILPQIEKMEAMQDEEYMALFHGYLNHMATAKPNKIAAIRENILIRKQRLRAEYEVFLTALIEDRCKKLHPAEAQALRERYYGVGGTKFSFAAAQRIAAAQRAPIA